MIRVRLPTDYPSVNFGGDPPPEPAMSMPWILIVAVALLFGLLVSVA